MATKTETERHDTIQEFCSIIANEDREFAASALREVDFNLEEAVVRYFSALESGPLPDTFTNDDIQFIGVRKRPHPDSADPIPKRSKLGDLSGPSTSKDDCVPSTSKDDGVPSTSNENLCHTLTSLSDVPQQVTVMSYNIDGCDNRLIKERIDATIQIIARVNPDILFLQGVTDRQDPLLRSFLDPIYNVYQGHNNFAYYTLTAVSKHITVERTQIVEFERTRMGRNLLIVEATWKDLHLKVINTHLESCWQGTPERKRQFVIAMDKMHEWATDPDVFMLFGGDLNLRDPEMANIPKGVQDAWIRAGSDCDNKYTWDTKLNFNKPTKTVCRSRYDRFFVRCPFKKWKFWLEGTKPIEDGIFPSDHFAIVCRFEEPDLI